MGIFAHRNCLKKVVLGYFYLVSLLSISALSVFGAEDNSILVAKRDPVKGELLSSRKRRISGANEII